MFNEFTYIYCFALFLKSTLIFWSVLDDVGPVKIRKIEHTLQIATIAGFLRITHHTFTVNNHVLQLNSYNLVLINQVIVQLYWFMRFNFFSFRQYTLVEANLLVLT